MNNKSGENLTNAAQPLYYVLVIYSQTILPALRKYCSKRCANIEVKDIEEICLLTILHASQTIFVKNESIVLTQLTTLTNIAAKYIQSEKMELESFSSDDGKGELLHSYSEHFHIGAQLSFLKELDKAKAIRSLNKRSFCVTDITRPHCMKILEQEKHVVRQSPLPKEQIFSKKIYSSRD